MSESARLDAAAAARLVVDALEAHGAAATATLVPDAGGAVERRVLSAGGVAGTLGDPGLDRAADALLRRALDGDEEPALREIEAGGDVVRVLIETHRAADELVVVGAGHIAVPLAELGQRIGMRVLVLDDREEFADAARFPDAVEVRRVAFDDDPFAGVALGPRSYVVLVTRAHRYDYDCLRRLVAPDRAAPAYVGMIGSRRRVRAAFHALLEAGVARERLAAVHAPVGLEIGAETPAEIAVSVIAEIVAVRRGAAEALAASISKRERVLDRLLPAGAGGRA